MSLRSFVAWAFLCALFAFVANPTQANETLYDVESYKAASEHIKNKQYSDAYNILLPRTKIGDAQAQFMIGDMHFEGQGFPQNYCAATYWYDKAARVGHVLAQKEMARAYSRGLGVKVDDEQAYRWLLHRYLNGSLMPSQQLDAYRKKLSPQHVKRIEHTMNSWRIENLPPAEVLTAPDEALNPEETRRAEDDQILAACSSGLPKSNIEYSVDEDWRKEQEVPHFIQYALDGNLDAQAQLLRWYFEGWHGLPKNRCLSIFWAERAARRGHKNAAAYMAYMHSGQGPNGSPAISYMWASIANKLGHEAGESEMYIWGSSTSEADRKRVDKLVSQWMPSSQPPSEPYFFEPMTFLSLPSYYKFANNVSDSDCF